MVLRKETNPRSQLFKASKRHNQARRDRPQLRSLALLPLGCLLVMAFALQMQVDSFLATCTRGSLSSFSQCSTQCEHLRGTSHEPASQLTEPVSAVNRAGRTLCRLRSGLSLGEGGWHYSLEPHPLLPPNIALSHQGEKGGVDGEVEGHRGGGVCFLLCVNNTTSVPQPGSWTKVK